MKKYFYIILSCILLLIGCKNNNTIDKNREINKKPEIIHLQDTYYSKFYHFNNFDENETCIKYLFDFANKNTGSLDIVSDKNSVRFEDGYSIDDFNSQRFAFARDGNTLKNTYIRVNYLKSKRINFKLSKNKELTNLFSDFAMLNLNVLQNFLDYAKEDKAKKEIETYTYILYNKNKAEKMKLIYHEYGAWFEVEVL